MSLGWLKQKRRVEQLTAEVDTLVARERARRSMLKSWAHTRVARYETVFWAGITGFVFLSRRRKEGKDERRNLFIELGLAAWAVQRWRKLPQRVEASLDRAREQLRSAAYPGPEHGVPEADAP